jgi:RecA/RadA recombinase
MQNIAHKSQLEAACHRADKAIKIAEIFGLPSSGKTILASLIVANKVTTHPSAAV